MDYEPILGGRLGHRRADTFEQRVFVREKARENSAPGPGADRRENIPKNRCRTTVAERMMETPSGTAPYRDQVGLFKTHSRFRYCSPSQGQWLRQVVTGFFAYHAVPNTISWCSGCAR